MSSKAAARAKRGDLGAKLEVTLAWLGAVAAGKEKLSISHVLMLGLFGALTIVGSGGLYVYMASKSVRLSVDDAAALKSVFLSGQPWIVECTAGAPSDVLYKAESKLAAPVKTALLDCSKTLPSGKTTIERFKLKTPGKGPFIIAVSNLELPVTAGYDAVATPEALAKWAASVTKPRVLAVSSSAQLDKSCLKKKWCLVVVSAGSRLLDAERKALSVVSQGERGVRYVTVDSSKFNLLLDIPNGVTPPSAQKSTTLLLKQLSMADKDVRTAATAVDVGLADPQAIHGALRAAIESTDELPAGFTRLDKRPMLKPREIAKPKPKAAQTRQPDDTSKTLTDDELKALRAERQAEAARLQREAEQQRREEMAAEEESAGNILEEISPLEEESDAEQAEEEEEEAEAMELDD